MAKGFIQVLDEGSQELFEIPLEPDDSVHLSTLEATFAGITGLKYRLSENGAWRIARVVEGKIFPPEEGWGNVVFHVICRKNGVVDSKRKIEDDGPDDVRKQARIEKKTCDLIVSGIPFSATEEDLRRYFASYGGLILCQVKKDYATGQSKGYAFVRFQEYDAQVKALGGSHMMENRKVWVKMSTSPRGFKTPAQVDNPKVFVGRLTSDITIQDLTEFFSEFGEVGEVLIPQPFRGFAFVTFVDAQVAQTLVGENFILRGASILITAAEDRQQRGKKQPTVVPSEYSLHGRYEGHDVRPMLLPVSANNAPDSGDVFKSPMFVAAFAQACAQLQMTTANGFDSGSAVASPPFAAGYSPITSYGGWPGAAKSTDGGAFYQWYHK